MPSTSSAFLPLSKPRVMAPPEYKGGWKLELLAGLLQQLFTMEGRERPLAKNYLPETYDLFLCVLGLSFFLLAHI